MFSQKNNISLLDVLKKGFLMKKNVEENNKILLFFSFFRSLF